MEGKTMTQTEQKESPQKYLAVSKETAEDCKIKLHVAVPKPTVHAAAKLVQKQILKHIKIPGFRRDKTPLPLVKRQVGAERFNEYVQRELLPKVYYEALEQENIQPISEVTYENLSITTDHFIFDALFSVAPEFSLGEYDKMSVSEESPATVEDSEIDGFLQDFANKHAEQKDPEDGSKTVEEDWVSVLVKGKIDGEDSKFLRHYNRGVILGKDEVFPGFDQHLLGKEKLERVQFSHEFAADFTNKALAGKTAELDVKILGHQKVEIPPIDDIFAKKLGPFETVDDLKQGVRKELENKASEKAVEDFKDRLKNTLHEQIECSVPESLVEELADSKLDELHNEIKKEKMSFEDYLASRGESEDELRVHFLSESEKALKLSFALTEIAKREGLEVEDREIIQRIGITAHMLQRPFEEILEYVESVGRRVLIRSELMQEKSLAHLQALYSVQEKEGEELAQ
jgi:trigger factor